MDMDYLDEATVEVAQASVHRNSSPDNSRLYLEGAAELKNQTQNLQQLQHFAHHENQLVNAGAELLAICVSVQRMPQPEDSFQFRQGLKKSITELKQRIASLDYPPSVADKTCFLFCIVLDEFILHTDWGEESGWANHALVSELFGMRDGGEQFYQVAEKALAQPNLLVDMLELIYIFIRIGFRGQYRLGHAERLEILVQNIETIIFRARPPIPFQANAKPDLPRTQKPARQAKFLRQLLLFGLAIGLVWGTVSYWYQNSLSQRAREFIALPEFTSTYLNVSDEEEVVYISTESEMQLSATAFRSQANVPVLAPRAPVIAETKTNPVQATARNWAVQLATFSDRENAQRFISQQNLENLGATIEPWKNQVRILVRQNTLQDARQLASQLQGQGIKDAFVISN